MVAVPRPKVVEEVAIAAAKVAVVVATVMAVTAKVAVVSAAEEAVVNAAMETVVVVEEAVVDNAARVVVDALELPVKMEEKLPLKAVKAVAEDVADREIEISPREIDSKVRHVRMPTQWTGKTELDVDVVATARQAVAEETGAISLLVHLWLKKSLRSLPPPPSRRRSRLLQSKRKRKLDIPLMTSLPRRLRNPPDS